MTNNDPWNNIEAFEPMFTESVCITCIRNGETIAQTIKVVVFNDDTGESLSESAIDTVREDILILCKRDDWGFVKTMQRGDTVERCEFVSKKYKVQNVELDSSMGIVIKARSANG